MTMFHQNRLTRLPIKFKSLSLQSGGDFVFVKQLDVKDEMKMEKVLEHEVRRPGYRSSEFWISIGAMALPVILPLVQDWVGQQPDGSPFAIIGGAIVAAGFAIGRSLVKKSRNETSAALAVAQAASSVQVGPLSSISGYMGLGPLEYDEFSSGDIQEDEVVDDDDDDLPEVKL